MFDTTLDDEIPELPLPKRGQSNRKIDYRCDKCGEPKSKAALKVKRVQFREMGESGHVIRTRTVAWFCFDCMEADPDYNRPAFTASPGLRDTLPDAQPKP